MVKKLLLMNYSETYNKSLLVSYVPNVFQKKKNGK
jgi:hypothetical protein